MTSICHATSARSRAKSIVENLKELLPRQQFAIAIQAAVGKKVRSVNRTISLKSAS